MLICDYISQLSIYSFIDSFMSHSSIYLFIYASSVAITADQIPTAVVADLGGGSGIKKFPYSGR
jgi:hypothetical protein